jgi:hypothetical protein
LISVRRTCGDQRVTGADPGVFAPLGPLIALVVLVAGEGTLDVIEELSVGRVIVTAEDICQLSAIASELPLGDGADRKITRQSIHVKQDNKRGAKSSDGINCDIEPRPIKFGAGVGIREFADDPITTLSTPFATGLSLRRQTIAVRLFGR